MKGRWEVTSGYFRPADVPERMVDTTLTADLRESLVRACRTAIGDDLRSIVYFTPDEHEQIYLREDLERGADIARFAENERLGFTSQETYGRSELGEYVFTIRAFTHGYVTRVILGDRGVFVTTDELSMDRFDEVAAAVRGVLREA